MPVSRCAGEDKENSQKSNKMDVEDVEDGEEDFKMLEGLRAKESEGYDVNKLTTSFLKIVNNPRRKDTKEFMPKGKCTHQKDGRQCMKVGDVNIFFDESVIDDIINISMRNKIL